MSQIDDRAIDKVLAALRDAEPPAGMESRILDALDQHRSAPTSPTPRSWLLPRRAGLPRAGLAGALAASLVLAALVGLTLLQPARQRSLPTPANHGPSTQPRPHPPADLAATSHSNHSNSTRKPPPSPSLKTASASQAPSRDLDALALSESLAPSLPAPPLPLTPQEQLLLRVLHRRDPDPLTDLNRELRAKQEAEQLADFDQFFNPSSPATHDNE